MNLQLNQDELGKVYKTLRVQIQTLIILNNRIDSDWIQEEITTLSKLSFKMAEELGIEIHPEFKNFGIGFVNDDLLELGKQDLIETIKRS